MTDEHVGDLIELYALGALEPEEQIGVDIHLESCEDCRALLADTRRVVDLIAWTPDQRTPPAELQQKVRRRIEQLQRRDTAAVASRRHLRLRSWHMPRLSWGNGLAAAALAALLLLAGWNIALQREVTTLTGQVAKLQPLGRVLSGAGVHVVTLGPQPAAPSAWGSMVINPSSTDAYFVVEGLPPLPNDKAYQLWLTRGENRASGGTFKVDPRGAATVVVRAPDRLDTYNGCGVTVEPVNGSLAPSGARVLRSQSWGSEGW